VNITAWVEFLKDFERKSQCQVDELVRTHEQQLLSLRKTTEESIKMKSTKWSKDLIRDRQRQSLMADQQRYEEAHQTKTKLDELEEKEQSDYRSSTDRSVMRMESNLTRKHQTEMEVLLKRIESKRREFQRQNDEECARLIQRNKNIQASYDSKHVSGSFV
jgi:hypothetical protein